MWHAKRKYKPSNIMIVSKGVYKASEIILMVSGSRCAVSQHVILNVVTTDLKSNQEEVIHHLKATEQDSEILT